MTTVELGEVNGEQLAAIDGSVEALRINRLRPATAAQISALWERIAATIVRLELHLCDGWTEIDAIDFAAAPRLTSLALTRVRVAASVLAHPTLETLKLQECFVGRGSAGQDELRVGPRLRSLTLSDCNVYVKRLIVEGESFAQFSLMLDEDAAEHSFENIVFRGPGITRVQHRAEWPTRIEFVGELPALKSAGVWIAAGNYSKPTVDVSGLPAGHPLASLPFQR